MPNCLLKYELDFNVFRYFVLFEGLFCNQVTIISGRAPFKYVQTSCCKLSRACRSEGQKCSIVDVRRSKDTRLYYTSAQRYIRPTIIVLILRTIPARVPMNCMSDTQSIFKKLAYPTYNWRPAHLPIGWMQSFEGRLHCISTGRMNNLRRSDAQHASIGRMHNFRKSDAHILQVTWHMYGKMHTFHMSDA